MAQAVAAPARGQAAAGPSAAFAAGTSYRWWVLVTVVFGAFVSILDNTIVNTAVPKIQAVFGADLHQASYIATGYTLATGIVVPATGFLANRFGIKKIYLASLTAFTIGSALCGLSWSLGALIFFRVLQGAGGAALFPLSFAILFATFSPAERGRANGFFGIPVLFAPAIGPTIGGYLVQYADWRWIFYVNVPIGIAGVLLGRRVLSDSAPRPELRFDLRGFLLAAPGLGLLLYGLSNLAYDGWGSTTSVSGPIIAGVLLLLVWVPVELRTRQPLLDLSLFKERNYLWGNVIIWIGTVGIFGPAFLLPQYLQRLRGLDPYPAGLLLFTSGVGTVVGTILAGQLYNRVGPRVLITIGAILTIVTSFQLKSWSTLDSPYSALPWILLVRGLGLPMFLQSSNTTALQRITGRALPGATTLNVVARQVVAALSIAVLVNLLDTRQITHQANLADRVSMSNPTVMAAFNALVQRFTGQGLSPGAARGAALGQLFGAVARQASTLSFQDIYLLTGLITIPVILLGFLLRADKRDQSQGQGRPQAASAE